MYSENHYQSVLALKPYAKAKHCWVCTIILRDPGHRAESIFNKRHKKTNCCDRCVQTGGQARKEKWLYSAVLDEFENQDLPIDAVNETYKKILNGIKFY